MSTIEIIPPAEQIIRKKAEEKPPKPPKPIVPKIRKEPKPTMILPDREMRAGVPVIPEDPCCAKVCRVLNDKIDFEREALNLIVSLEGGRTLYESRTYRSTVYGIEALEDHRHKLKEKESCRCVEETGAVSIILPLVQATERLEKEKFLMKNRLPFKGPMFRVPSPERARKIHIKEKPITPPSNNCCTNACKILNDDIDENNKILDNMELTGGSEVYKNPRYEALSYKNFALQKYRADLKARDSCKCIE